MAKTYPGLSAERHKELGRELKEIQDRLMAIDREIGRTYRLGHKVHRPAGHSWWYEKLRSTLDDASRKEHGDIWDPIWYYPPIQPPAVPSGQAEPDL